VPLLVVIWAAVALTGPALYRQRRVGRFGHEFMMIKFRTMSDDAEGEGGPTLAAVRDPRVTLFGRYLRRLRLDELPQLWNVVLGDMSLVGPRPERPEFMAELRQVSDHHLRELVRPGLTGTAQLRCGYYASQTEKVGYDVEYLRHWTLRGDVGVLLQTAMAFVRGFPRG
jgi:lipopolysaccharide/colanic/teichoic acid biosynthesis glycosyltransferase